VTGSAANTSAQPSPNHGDLLWTARKAARIRVVLAVLVDTAVANSKFGTYDPQKRSLNVGYFGLSNTACALPLALVASQRI
jgi:hypothetical protein